MAIRQDFFTGKWIVLFVYNGEVISRHGLPTEEAAREWEKRKRQELEKGPMGSRAAGARRKGAE